MSAPKREPLDLEKARVVLQSWASGLVADEYMARHYRELVERVAELEREVERLKTMCRDYETFGGA